MHCTVGNEDDKQNIFEKTLIIFVGNNGVFWRRKRPFVSSHF
jgi:hypothetical protein